jgi:hypothetical protein
VGGVADVTQSVVSSSTSLLGKVKALSLPTIKTQPGVPAQVQLTSDGTPGLAVATRTAPTAYYVGGAVILGLVYMLLRK